MAAYTLLRKEEYMRVSDQKDKKYLIKRIIDGKVLIYYIWLHILLEKRSI